MLRKQMIAEEPNGVNKVGNLKGVSKFKQKKSEDVFDCCESVCKVGCKDVLMGVGEVCVNVLYEALHGEQRQEMQSLVG